MVQNPAQRGRSGSANGMGALGALPLGAGGGIAGLGTAARSQLAAMQTASQLGLHPSTLASLQAGLMPATAGMSLQAVPMGAPLPADGMQQHAFGGPSSQPAGSFGALQW